MLNGLLTRKVFLVATLYQIKISVINKTSSIRMVTNGFHSFMASSDIDTAKLYNL